MTDREKLDRALAALRQSGQSEPLRQMDPTAYERNPPDFQRKQERERDGSSWAGSSMGGGSWGGRTR